MAKLFSESCDVVSNITYVTDQTDSRDRSLIAKSPGDSLGSNNLIPNNLDCEWYFRWTKSAPVWFVSLAAATRQLRKTIMRWSGEWNGSQPPIKVLYSKNGQRGSSAGMTTGLSVFVVRKKTFADKNAAGRKKIIGSLGQTVCKNFSFPWNRALMWIELRVNRFQILQTLFLRIRPPLSYVTLYSLSGTSLCN